MALMARPLTLLVACASATFIPQGVAWAQAQAPASAAFPPAPSEPQPAPAASPAAPTSAATPPASQPVTPAPAYPQQPALPEPPPPAPPGSAPYAQNPSAQPGYGYPPPPPPQNPDDGFKVPDFSVRVDPFNWLLAGRLGLELETQVYKFISIELVPVFVTSHTPPLLNYDTYSSNTLTQSSNGLGAISGAAIDVAFWFDSTKPFRSYALRTGFTNYAYTYETSDAQGPIDSVSHTNREFFVMLADSSRWKAFMLGGGIGLGYELNRQNRCFEAANPTQPTSNCPKDQQFIRLDRSGTPYNLNSFLYPFDFLVRFSLGVVF